MSAKPEKRSPIKARPLRYPGQSLDDALIEKILDVLCWTLVPVVLVIFAGIEWYRELSNVEPYPVTATAIAVASIVVAFWINRRRLRDVRRLKQGRDGERVVGQFLERLRESGWQVFHDVPGEGFNVDHVAIGPNGIYTLETKTWSTPVRGRPEIVVDDDGLKANGLVRERNPLIQACAQANWLAQLLQESTGKRFDVQAAVLFPGWYIKDARRHNRRPWVLEPKRLPAYLQNEPKVLLGDEISLASFHLSRYIRAQI